MSRKTYVRIAAALKDALPAVREDKLGVMWDTAGRISDALAEDNAAFDHAKFMKACGF